MTPEELSRIREIYEQAMPMSSSERAALLDRECLGREGLRDEIERLLQAHDNVPTWLDRPAFVPAPPKLEGRRLSGYTLIREIGRGGMGSVYLAERSDETFHRQVAIKLVLPPANTGAIIAQFQHEREIVASLDHPNIAKLLDAGVTEEGWPYFVMEFVDGQPIHRWCDERKLNTSQRVELFRGVIDAVRYAHQRLVIHRDLKPSNIMVTNDGIVKLLDFGIAKVLSPAVAGEAPDTVTLALMMTPAYASPEQMKGAPITTLSDVYSLGVILYELLTGHRPYRLMSAAMDEMVRVIAEVEPARPSEVVATSESAPGRNQSDITPEMVSAAREGDPRRLRQRLAGDLDSILLMALRKEPERRYGSVESFAEDLQRHLDQRPIKAREATPWEHFRRLQRRNPGGFVAGSLVAILILAGLGAVAWHARHDLQPTGADPAAGPFLTPLWLFSSGVYMGALYVAGYFARARRAQYLGAIAGGIVWAFGSMNRFWWERDLGWVRGRAAENSLMLFSPLSWLALTLMGAAILLILTMIGRRFGWKGQTLSLAVYGLFQPALDRALFGAFIPALNFQPGPLPILGGAAILFAVGATALLVMRLVGGPDTAGAERK